MQNCHEHRDGNVPPFGGFVRTSIPVPLLPEDLTDIVYVLRGTLTMRTAINEDGQCAYQQDYTGCEYVFSEHRIVKWGAEGLISTFWPQKGLQSLQGVNFQDIRLKVAVIPLTGVPPAPLPRYP